MKDIIDIKEIKSKIYLIRDRKVMLDSDLADLYGVETKQLKRQVKRNIERFPDDFMYELTKDEFKNLRCQIGTSSSEHGGSRYIPMVFTELGVAMLSSVLNSARAINVNIQIMRAFVELRKAISTHEEIKKIKIMIKNLELKDAQHDNNFEMIFEVLEKMLAFDEKDKKKIGFD